MRMREIPREAAGCLGGREGGGKGSRVGAEEFTLSSFPGFIFHAPSAKLLEFSLVPFSSDNGPLLPLAQKAGLTRKLAPSSPVRRMLREGGRERDLAKMMSFLLFAHDSYASPLELIRRKLYIRVYISNVLKSLYNCKYYKATEEKNDHYNIIFFNDHI